MKFYVLKQWTPNGNSEMSFDSVDEARSQMCYIHSEIAGEKYNVPPIQGPETYYGRPVQPPRALRKWNGKDAVFSFPNLGLRLQVAQSSAPVPYRRLASR